MVNHTINATPPERLQQEHAKDVFTCFVDLEKAYNRVPCEKLWGVLREYGVDGRLSLAVKSLYIPAQKFVSVSGELNHDRSPLVLDSRQRCVLPPLLFIVYISASQPFR